MADTLTTQSSTLATIPSGSVVATDDAGAAGHVQVVKLARSADGSATPITADADGLEVQGAGVAGYPAGGVVSVQGVASGTAVPVSAASLPLPSGAATLAEQQTQTTALQLIDDTVYTDGTGTPSKAIGIAGTDGTNPQIVKTDASGELQVDVLTLPTVTIGAALPAGTNNIGDVDVLTVPAPLSTTGGGTEAAALRVTLASDSTGLISVDDNGGSLTIDGSVSISGAVDTELTTADLDTGAGTDTRAVVGLVRAESGGAVLVGSANPLPVNDASGSLTVDAPVATPVFVRLSDGSAAIATLPVSLASAPSTPVTNAGTFAVQESGAALTALQLLDNAVKNEDDASANLDAGFVILAKRSDTPAATSGTDGDYEPLQVTGGRLATSAAQSGTWTVQPGNTANTTAWKVDGSAVTQPVSLASVPSHAVTNAGTFAVQSAAAGDVASDAVDSGNPVKVGAIAKSADITAVADADRVNLIASLLGKLVSLPYATPALTWSYAAAAGGLVTTSGVTAKAAGTGAQRQYVTSAHVINSHQTISTEVVIRDGAAGTVLWRGWAQAAGGGCAAKLNPPLRGTAATLIEIAEVTTTGTARVLVNLQGFTAAE